MNVAQVVDATVTPLDDVLEEVARVVFAGGTVIFPTDTSYAIACDPYHPESVDRIYGVKQRPDERPMTMHVASPAEFLEYAGDSPLAALAAKRLLPGPVIFLIDKPAFVGDDLAAGLQTMAFRVPDDSFARALLERCGPLAGTAVHVREPVDSPRYRGGDDYSMLPVADLLVRHGAPRYDRESSIVDLTGPRARLLREGAVPFSRLTELLGPLERPTVKVRTTRP